MVAPGPRAYVRTQEEEVALQQKEVTCELVMTHEGGVGAKVLDSSAARTAAAYCNTVCLGPLAGMGVWQTSLSVA